MESLALEKFPKILGYFFTLKLILQIYHKIYIKLKFCILYDIIINNVKHLHVKKNIYIFEALKNNDEAYIIHLILSILYFVGNRDFYMRVNHK